MSKSILVSTFIVVLIAGTLLSVATFAITLANINNEKRLRISDMLRQQSTITKRLLETKSLIDDAVSTSEGKSTPAKTLRSKSALSEELQNISRDTAKRNNLLLSNTQITNTSLDGEITLVVAKMNFQTSEDKLLRFVSELEMYKPEFGVRALRISDNGKAANPQLQLNVYVEFVGIAKDET